MAQLVCILFVFGDKIVSFPPSWPILISPVQAPIVCTQIWQGNSRARAHYYGCLPCWQFYLSFGPIPPPTLVAQKFYQSITLFTRLTTHGHVIWKNLNMSPCFWTHTHTHTRYNINNYVANHLKLSWAFWQWCQRGDPLKIVGKSMSDYLFI